METAVPYRSTDVKESSSNDRRRETGSELRRESLPKAPASWHTLQVVQTCYKKASRVVLHLLLFLTIRSCEIQGSNLRV